MLTHDMHVHLPSFYILVGSFLTPLDLHIQGLGYFMLLISYLRSTKSLAMITRILWYSSYLPFHSVDFF